jgi:NADH-quinone oxidoreductase subunit G
MLETAKQARKLPKVWLMARSVQYFSVMLPPSRIEATQLHALALELGKLTNGTSGSLARQVTLLVVTSPGHLPSGANARQMFEQPRKAYVLMGIEPEFDCANPQLVLAALKQAGLVVYMSAFKHQPGT